MNAEELFSLNDLSQGLNEWKSIQYVVRETFKKFHEVLQSQSDAINKQASAIARIEKTLENKMSKSEVQAGLNLKANIAEVGVVNRRISELSLMLEDKLDKAEIFSELSKKASTTELSSRFTEVVTLMDERLQFRKDMTKAQPTPAHKDTALDEIEKLKAKLEEKASKEELKQVAASKVDTTEFTSTINEIVQHANEISDTLNGKASIKLLESQLDREKKAVRQEMQSLRTSVENIIQRNTEDVEVKKDSLNSSFKDAERDLKKMEIQFKKREEALNERIMQLSAELEDIKSMLYNQNNANEALKQEIAAELEHKANVEDVNIALNEINNQVCNPANGKNAANVNSASKSKEQDWSIVPHTDSCGRWLWKSKKTKVNAVPWNVQCLNTNQQCFAWEKNKASITVNLPGLYELIFAFFCRNQTQASQIQLVINGQPVSSASLTDIQTHTSGNITGSTFVDYFALPSKSKLLLTYKGDMDVEAFLSLRKL